MARSKPKKSKRVLIASNHGLFGEGLRSLLQEREEADVDVIGVVSTVDEALQALKEHEPDLIVVDYDDEVFNRDEILARFLEAGKQLRVVLLSLHDGGKEALVYDRRTMAASQIDDWLKEWTSGEEKEELPATAPEEPAKAEDRRGNSMKHLIIAGILVVIVTALLIVGLGQARILPVAASAQAEPIDWMFNLEFRVIAFLFALIVVFMVYSIVVFRRKKGDTTDARHIEGNSRLEVVWTIIPLATVLYFAYLGSQTLAETQRIEESLEVDVIGQQWSWRFEYPDSGIISNELRLPVNKQALLHLSSIDVLHSFWVPEFRVKQDLLPGDEDFVRDLRVTPTRIGEYKVRCAELCGTQHAYMTAPVIVMSQADFDAWVASQTMVEGDPVARGEQWYQTFGCQACHSIDGVEGVGPTWKGLYGSTVEFDDGTSTVADDDYLYGSIRNPGAEIVQGYANVMPANIADAMTDEQIEDIIRFIESLE